MKEYALFLRNLLKVASSQMISLASGVVVAFVVPKVLGVTGYGFYKLYTLYFAYTSLLHFGFIDGFLLKYAGSDYQDLDKEKTRTLSRFYMGFQLLMGLVLLLAAQLFRNSDYRFLCAMLGLNLFVINCTSYYQFVSQATQRFTEYSLRNTVISVAKILTAAVLALLARRQGGPVSYRLYLLMTSAVDLAMLALYSRTYRDITFGRGTGLRAEKETIKELFRTGIVLTVAYQVGHFVFVLDRQFVSVLFDTDTYSVYAFSYNIQSVFTTVVAAFATVMFPMLKRLPRETAIARYPVISAGISALAAFALLGCYPVVWLVRWLLPEYAGSMAYFRIIFPSLLLTTGISVVGFTFFKILKENLWYFFIGVGVLLLGAALNALAYIRFRDPAGISWASLVTLTVWYLAIGIFLKGRYAIPFLRSFLYILSALGLFYGCIYGLGESLVSAGCYLASVTSLTLGFYGKSLGTLWKQRRG